MLKKTAKAKTIVVMLALALLGDRATYAFYPQEIVEPTLSPLVHEIDPIFRCFYLYYGGLEVFGPAIAKASLEGEMLIQYTEAAMMIYDPQASITQRFRLAPLGSSIAIREPQVPQPQDGNYIYRDGHIIQPVFAQEYLRLENILGKPLTEGYENYEYRRMEQLFENMGLTYDLASGKIGFLPYGVAMCDKHCQIEEP